MSEFYLKRAVEMLVLEEPLREKRWMLKGRQMTYSTESLAYMVYERELLEKYPPSSLNGLLESYHHYMAFQKPYEDRKKKGIGGEPTYEAFGALQHLMKCVAESHHLVEKSLYDRLLEIRTGIETEMAEWIEQNGSTELVNDWYLFNYQGMRVLYTENEGGRKEAGKLWGGGASFPKYILSSMEHWGKRMLYHPKTDKDLRRKIFFLY